MTLEPKEEERTVPLLMLWSMYVLPLPVFALAGWLWWRLVPDRAFVALVLGLPVVYGYVVPGVATNVLRRWRFHGRFLLGRYFAHHGFLYAWKMTLILLLPFVLLGPGASPTAWQSAAVVALTGLAQGFVFWWHDIHLVKCGMVELNRAPARGGKSPEEVVTRYAPLSFFLIGATYASSALLGHHVFVVSGSRSAAAVLGVWTASLALMFTLPSLAYRRLDRDVTPTAAAPLVTRFGGFAAKTKKQFGRAQRG